MLHAASRLEAGLELTDLEARMVAPLRLLMSQEEVHAFGRLYREETSARSTAAVFPDAIISRPVADGYVMADLAKDLPGLREETLAQANVSVVDVDSAPVGDGSTWDTEEFNAGQAAYGYGVTMVTASAASQPSQDPGANASI